MPANQRCKNERNWRSNDGLELRVCEDAEDGASKKWRRLDETEPEDRSGYAKHEAATGVVQGEVGLRDRTARGSIAPAHDGEQRVHPSVGDLRRRQGIDPFKARLANRPIGPDDAEGDQRIHLGQRSDGDLRIRRGTRASDSRKRMATGAAGEIESGAQSRLGAGNRARYRSDFELSHRALLAIRRRSPADAGKAAFFLGRVEEARGNYELASRWYSEAAEARQGAGFVSEARAAKARVAKRVPADAAP